MFTVLIAEQKHIDAIKQDNCLFFEPFLSNKELVFCAWNPEGQSLNEAVPGLLDAVGRRKEWRAVILHSSTDEQLKKQNPFDVVDASEVLELQAPDAQPDDDEDWKSWVDAWSDYYERLTPLKENTLRSAMKLPLQKLSTWLCYRPAKYILEEVADKIDVEDWAMAAIDGNDLKPNSKLEELEREQYHKELRIKEIIRQEFAGENSINISMPTEIDCVSERVTEHGFFHPDSFWTIRSGNSYSAFVDRNMFFDKMRFLVFDVLPKAHKDYRNNRVKFLFSLLIFATNNTPVSAMQPRRLYLLESENDETSLCTLATSFERKLTSTGELIENEIDEIRSEIPAKLQDKEAEALFCTPADVPISIEKGYDEEALEVDENCGLSSSCPESEMQRWEGSYSASKKALSYIIKRINRSINKCVSKVDSLCQIEGADAFRLTQLQIEDVREYTEEAENEMVNHIPKNISDTDSFVDPIKESAENVKKTIDRRMSRKTTILLGVICLSLFVFSLIPMLISNLGNSRTISTALIIIAAVIFVIALILIITLFFLRRPLKSALATYNEQTRSTITSINKELGQYSAYLSSLCNARRGYSVMRYASSNVDEYTMGIRIRKKHQEDIRMRRAYLIENYSDYILDGSFLDEAMCQPYNYDFSLKKEYSYPAPSLAGDSRQVEFLVSGNYVSVPSSYVSRLLIRMEEIYDK